MARRTKTTGVVKAVPKTGETKEEAIARVQAMHPNEKVVDPPRSDRGSRTSSPFGSGSGRSGYGELISEPIFPVHHGLGLMQPTKQLKLYDGSVWSTPYGRDPFRVNKLEVAVLEYANVGWANFVSPGGADPGATLPAQRVLQIFQLLVDVINYNGRFTPNQILTTAADFPSYLINWTVAFTGLYTLMSIPVAMDLNQSMRIINTTLATGGLIDRVVYDWRRLNMIPIPPMLEDVMAKICGIFANDSYELVYMSHVNNAGSILNVTDFTLNTGANSVTALLVTIETALNALEVGTAEGNIIQELMAMVYGPPKKFKDPSVHMEACLYDMCYTRCVVAKDETAGFFQACPQIPLATATAGSPVPILERKVDQDPQLATYLRPQFVSFDSGGYNATVHLSGLLRNDASATYARVYGPAAPNNTILDDSQPAAAFGAFAFDSTTFYEIEWWAPIVLGHASPGLAKWDFDVRDYDRWEEYYISIANIATSTIQLIDEIFLSSVGIRALR